MPAPGTRGNRQSSGRHPKTFTEGDIPRRMGKAKATFEHQKLLWVGDIVPRFRGDNLRSN